MELAGKTLLAMPGMGDPRFERSVIFLCAHSDEGAMGLIVNRPAPDLGFGQLLAQLSIDHAPGAPDPAVHLGGPVEHGRGFVLHSDDYTRAEATLTVPGGYAMTATTDVLEDIARGAGPRCALLALGYSGWGPGQLESEMAANAWLVGDADPDIVFGRDSAGKWGAILARMGIDPVTLSGAAGRA